MVAGGGLLTGLLDCLGDFGEKLLVNGGDFVERGGHLHSGRISLRGVGRRLAGVGSLLGRFGVSDGRIDGRESFGGANILGVDGEDSLEFGLGGLKVAFVASLQGFGEELRLAGGSIAILGDK